MMVVLRKVACPSELSTPLIFGKKIFAWSEWVAQSED